MGKEQFTDKRKTDKSGNRRNSKRHNAQARNSGGKNYHAGCEAGDRGSNHISWYVPSNELLNQVGAIPFADPMGLSTEDAQYSEPIPGIAVLTWVPSYAMGYQAQQDLKIAMNKIWADIRAKNSRSATYQPADLMLYFLSMDNIYIMYSMAVRAYGIMRHYDVFNRYLARTLVQACGFDYESLSANLNDFRYFINMMAMRLNHIPIPATLPIISKHAWMSNNVWRETDSPKSQLYLFRPSHIYVYSATQYDTGGALLVRKLQDYMGSTDNPGAGMSVTQFGALVEELVEAVAYDDDFTAMAGDIIKAYEPGDFFYMEEVPEGYTVDIKTIANDQDAYEVIVGFHNADVIPFTFIGNVRQQDGNRLSQSFNVEYGYNEDHDPEYQNNFAYEISALGYGLTHRKWIDLIKPDPTPENVMYATRYMVGHTELGDNGITDMDFGTEAITSLLIFRRPEGSADVLNYHKYDSNYVACIDTSVQGGNSGRGYEYASLSYNVELLAGTTCFKYLPFLGPVKVELYDGTNPGFSNTAAESRIWSIEYATTTDPDSISKLHSVARLSEFGINLFKSGTSVN